MKDEARRISTDLNSPRLDGCAGGVRGAAQARRGAYLCRLYLVCLDIARGGQGTDLFCPGTPTIFWWVFLAAKKQCDGSVVSQVPKEKLEIGIDALKRDGWTFARE